MWTLAMRHSSTTAASSCCAALGAAHISCVTVLRQLAPSLLHHQHHCQAPLTSSGSCSNADVEVPQRLTSTAVLAALEQHCHTIPMGMEMASGRQQEGSGCFDSPTNLPVCLQRPARQQQQQQLFHLVQLPQSPHSQRVHWGRSHGFAPGFTSTTGSQQQLQQQQPCIQPHACHRHQQQTQVWLSHSSSLWLQPHRRFHDQSKPPTQHQEHHQQQHQQPGDIQSKTQPAEQQQSEPQGQLPGSSWTTLPNLLSLSRVAMGPWLAYSITTQQWPVAVALTAAAGASDWLDGSLARWLGHTSKLGSYLDPLADKVFVATAVGTLGYIGMVPGWLAVLVVGRDSAQVAGMFWYRLRMFGGVWPGATAFFDVDHSGPGHAVSTSSSGKSAAGSSSSAEVQIGSADVGAQQQAKGEGQQQPSALGGLPMIRPLLISKANTALVMALVACCMGHEWQGLPDADVLGALEVVTAGTTMASAGAYAHLYLKGKLLEPAEPSQQGKPGQ